MISLRLEFDYIFPEEEKKTAYEYLQNVSKETLQESIGFFAIPRNTDYHNFFSNPSKQNEIWSRVNRYLGTINFPENISCLVISEHGILKIQELILSNKSTLFDNNSLKKDIDRDEINLLVLLIKNIFVYLHYEML